MRSAASVSSKSLEQLPARGLGVAAATARESSPTSTRFWVPVSSSSRVASWPVTPMMRRTARRRSTTSSPATPAGAAVGAGHGREHADGGRLAGAVGAEHAEDAGRRATSRSTPSTASVVAVALAGGRRPRSWGVLSWCCLQRGSEGVRGGDERRLTCRTVSGELTGRQVEFVDGHERQRHRDRILDVALASCSPSRATRRRRCARSPTGSASPRRRSTTTSRARTRSC